MLQQKGVARYLRGDLPIKPLFKVIAMRLSKQLLVLKLACNDSWRNSKFLRKSPDGSLGKLR